MAITGLTKAAKAVGHYVGRKAKYSAYRGVIKTANATERAGNATANLVRKAVKASDAFDNATLGPIGKATRNVSAAVIKATRSARPRARETVGQMNARKGIVNKKYTPSPRMHMEKPTNINGKINLKKSTFSKKEVENFRRDRGTMNYNQKKDGMVGNADNYPNKPMYMHEIPNNKPQDNIGRMTKTYNDALKSPSMPQNLGMQHRAAKGPRYTNKQVRAGRKVALGAAATGYAASEYFKAKKNR
jgi:hypothetical protein